MPPTRIAKVNNVLLESLTPKRLRNYQSYITKINTDIANGRQAEIATIELDRPGTNWSQSLRYDCSISLRCQGPEIFVLSLYDLDKDPLDRDFHGWLTNNERFRLVGHKGEYHCDFHSQRASRTATGNAYTMPMMAAAVVPLIDQAITSGVLRTPKRPALNEDEILELIHAKRRKVRSMA